MMALDPADRYQDPAAVMRALLPFLKPDSAAPLPTCRAVRGAASGVGAAEPRVHRVLLVDDERSIREFCRAVLEGEGIRCDDADDAATALAAVAGSAYDLVLLDVHMPDSSGLEVLRRLRQAPPCPHLKVVMFSGQSSADEMAEMLLGGADDYLTKPFSVVQLVGRIQAALRLKEAQDRSDLLNRHILAVNAELERNLSSRDSALAETRNALVLGLARVVEHREGEGSNHLLRMQRYGRVLAETAAQTPTFAAQLDANFVEMLVCCVPLHDIGKVGLPDHILLKPGKLTAEERLLMQAHTTLGAETLAEVARRKGAPVAFLQMAIDIIRHHHERSDGAGYPDRLAGSAIPLAARLVAIADVYDALRSRRSYKPALSHTATLQIMTEASPGQFDPALLQAFVRCAAEFDRIFQELPG
jgi:response regulator RpfG family c-di-GMP phosphodiesterase